MKQNRHYIATKPKQNKPNQNKPNQTKPNQTKTKQNRTKQNVCQDFSNKTASVDTYQKIQRPTHLRIRKKKWQWSNEVCCWYT